MPKASLASTVNTLESPAVTGELIPPTRSVAAGPGVTTTPLCVPVIEPVAMSVAVTECVAALRRIRPENVKTPASAAVKA